jgi:hypothetical protein
VESLEIPLSDYIKNSHQWPAQDGMFAGSMQKPGKAFAAAIALWRAVGQRNSLTFASFCFIKN